jgi:hypothetical protein
MGRVRPRTTRRATHGPGALPLCCRTRRQGGVPPRRVRPCPSVGEGRERRRLRLPQAHEGGHPDEGGDRRGLHVLHDTRARIGARVQAARSHVCEDRILQGVMTREQAHFAAAASKGTSATACTRPHALRKRRESEIFSVVPLFGSQERGTAKAFPVRRLRKPPRSDKKRYVNQTGVKFAARSCPSRCWTQ